MESRSIPMTLKSHSRFSLDNLNPFIEQVGVTSPFFQNFAQITKKTFFINSITSSPRFASLFFTSPSTNKNDAKDGDVKGESRDFNSEIRDKTDSEGTNKRTSFITSSSFAKSMTRPSVKIKDFSDLVTNVDNRAHNRMDQVNSPENEQTLFSRSIDRQSFFPVVKNSINRTRIAFSKNSFGLGQCNSDNQYPYKVDNHSAFLSDRSNNLAADVTKASLSFSSPFFALPSFTEREGDAKKSDVKEIYADSLNVNEVNKENSKNKLQVKYNKFHTLPIFSTFIYKEWSHRFSFLEYFIWSAQKNDLALPFYTRRGACHTARINSMNLIRNKIGLKKTRKQFLFSFNGCTKNILWNERFQKVPWLETMTNKMGDNQSSKKIQKQIQSDALQSRITLSPSFLSSSIKEGDVKGETGRSNVKKSTKTIGGDQGNEVKENSTTFRASFDNRRNKLKEGDPSVDTFKSTAKLSNRRLDWLYFNGGSKNISNFSQMPTPSPKSEYFLELRDKAVSLTLCVESHNLAKLPSTVNVKENPKQLFASSMHEKSSVVFRQMDNFFGWEFSLSSENLAVSLQTKPKTIKNPTNFSSFSFDTLLGNVKEDDAKGSVSLKNSSLLDVERGSKKELTLEEKSLDAANKKELLIAMDDNFYTPSIKGIKKKGGQLKEIAKIKPKISLASGNFRQLLPLDPVRVRSQADVNEVNKKPSDKNRIQSTRWQESSLMWGKVDDTQQFPRLAQLLHFTGGKALRHLLSRFHLILLGKFLRYELKNLELKVNFLLALKILTYSQGLLLGKLAKRRSKQIRRLKLLELFQSKKSNPEWMILSVLPVLPPDLRPILRVNDDFVVASDLNRLYQTVLRRNNTIHERLDDPLPCPESGLFRQRSLQKAVDGLLENGKGGGTPLCASKRRPLVSLSHVLKGKKGLFRQHLLGKRVDYSGRSVIVVGPKLNLHECGLPKEMALELFQPFLIHRLKVKGLATSNTTARRMIHQEDPIIWHTVKQLVYEHPVLLNRAPTLHRLGIQAFQPRLVSGRAILLHPLVCNGFNADFDGDQMAVHVPLSFQARAEAWKIMWSKNNLLSPATGQPILVPSQDMVLGCYYLSVVVPRALHFSKSKKNVRVFSNGGDASKTGSPQSAPKKKHKVSDNISPFFDTLQSNVSKKGDSGYFKKTEIKNFSFENRKFSLYFKDKVNLFAKLSTVKSCKFIHPPGYFKKIQHLGFLTNANLLQRIDTMEMPEKIPDFPSQTHFLPSSVLSLRPISSNDLGFVFHSVKQKQSNITSNASDVNGVNNEMQRPREGDQAQFFRGEVNGNKVNKNNLCYWLRTTNVDKVNKKVNQWQEKASLENYKKHVNQAAPKRKFLEKSFSKKSDRTMIFQGERTKNSAYLFERGHYFSSLHDSLMAYAQGRLQTHTPFWVRLDYFVANEKKKTSVLHTNYRSTLEPKVIPVSNPHGVIERVLQSKETKIISLVDLQKRKQHPLLLQPRYGCSQEVSKVLFQEDHNKFVIEGNDALEAPLELRLGADGNLVKIFTTFQNHYSCNATILHQCKEKSIRYMRTTAGRVVINETLFHHLR